MENIILKVFEKLGRSVHIRNLRKEHRILTRLKSTKKNRVANVRLKAPLIHCSTAKPALAVLESRSLCGALDSMAQIKNRFEDQPEQGADAVIIAVGLMPNNEILHRPGL